MTRGGTYQLKTEVGTIWEVSPSTMNACGLQLPVAGGGYFRLFPYAASKMFLKNLEKQGSQLVMYLHPWEIDPEQPRMDGPVLSKIRHYLNLGKTEQRLRWLLKDFSFAPINEVIRPILEMSQGQRECPHAIVENENKATIYAGF